MDELLKMLEELNLSEEEKTHSEYILAKLFENKMPVCSLTKEDWRQIKENGWYAFIHRHFY